MANWEGAVSQHGEPTVTIDDIEVAVQHRLTAWLHDGLRLVLVSDAGGEEALEVHRVTAASRRSGLPASTSAVPCFCRPLRPAIKCVDQPSLRAGVGRSGAGRGQGARPQPLQPFAWATWAPDGHWLAYGFFNSEHTSIIKLVEVDSGATHELTRPVLHDEEPAWDPDGRFLYFLSARDFDPVYDSLHFELSFPRGMRPYLITLRKDLLSPFLPEPRAPGGKPGKKKIDKDKDAKDEDDEGRG